MAGRLRKAAKRNARLQYAPVRRDIHRQRGEAKQTYRSGRRQERQAARGIRAAAEAALADVKHDYRSSMAESRLADKLGGDLGEGIFAEADTLSRRQAKRGIAEAMAAELADLHARGVQAQEAAAYGTRALRGARDTTLKGLSQERAATAREQGQFALSELTRLQGERSDRRIARRGLALDEAAFAETQRQNRVGNRLARRGIRLDEYEAHHPGASTSRGPDSVHSQGLKQDVLDMRAGIKAELDKGTSVEKIRKSDQAKENPTLFDAAFALAHGYRLSAAQVKNLHRIGMRVPRAWTHGRKAPRGGVLGIRGIGG